MKDTSQGLELRKLRREAPIPYRVACQAFGKSWQASTSVLPQSDLWSL